MRREQLEHAIRTACQVIGGTDVIVVGSQAILGTFREDELPVEATMSIEVDILPIADDNEKTARLADLSRVLPVSSRRSRNSTASVSTGSIWRRRYFPRAGATVWS
jgi:hypothetical protein